MCEKELSISFGNILLLLENGILGRVSSMLKLHLTKATQGSHLVGTFLSTTPTFWLQMTCRDVENYFPVGLMTILVHMEWIVVDGET